MIAYISRIKEYDSIMCWYKISYLLGKLLVLSIICSKCTGKDEKIFKEEESIEILKIIGLIENI